MFVVLTDLFPFLTFFLFQVASKGVGIVSRSKGGDIALALASFVPGIEAIVWINGSSADVAIPLCYKNRHVLSPICFDFSKAISSESGATMIKHCTTNPLAEENKGSLVPIEQAKGRFLFVASEDDLNWDSKGFMENMVDRLRHHGKDNFESVCYASTGHILDPSALLPSTVSSASPCCGEGTPKLTMKLKSTAGR